MPKSKPTISVVMPVYNSGKYVAEAVNSILQQSFPDFEFIIVDDASTDCTSAVLDSVVDSRIIRINNKEQKGNYKCRNQALQIAKGKYICTMDSDDISHIDRLAIQFDFLETNAEFVATGSDVEFFSGTGQPSIFRRIADKEELKVALLRNNTCTHPTLLINNEVMKKHQLYYNEDYYYSADYNLIVDLSRFGFVTNISQPLLRYRIHSGQITTNHYFEQEKYADQIRLKQLSFFKIRPSIDEIIIHLDLVKENPISNSNLELAENWFNKLLVRNNHLRIYNQEQLFRFFEQHLSIAINQAF